MRRQKTRRARKEGGKWWGENDDDDDDDNDDDDVEKWRAKQETKDKGNVMKEVEGKKKGRAS